MALDTSADQPAPVRQINQLVGGWIERLGSVWVAGQVTQISRRGGMNTVFLTLRDNIADISVQATTPKAVIDALPAPLVEGAQIVVHAKPSFYANRGTFSLSLREIRLAGDGELLARIERRRQLLAAEGLFADIHKRPLPFLPRSIGLVTAENSAAEKDVLENARHRWPGARFVTRYAAMQGANSVREVIEALSALEAEPTVDVIVIARGGGSPEDLLPFSDEGLIRHVYAMSTPTVSAIGHEQDSPLLDLVADVRASTPTDAAKRVTPDVTEELAAVQRTRERARLALRTRIEHELHALTNLRSRPVLSDPGAGLDDLSATIEQHRQRARRALNHRVERAHDETSHHLARVRALSPLATLRRGYAVLSDAEGEALSSVTGVERGAHLHIRLADGRIAAQATDIDEVPLAGTTPEEPMSEETDD